MVKYYYEKRDPAWYWLDSIYHEKRFLIIIGAIMLAIGFIGAIPLVLLYKWGSSTRVRSHNSTPRAIFFGIISPLYAEIVFIFIITGNVGIAVLVLSLLCKKNQSGNDDDDDDNNDISLTYFILFIESVVGVALPISVLLISVIGVFILFPILDILAG
jgi:hypothetical protein